MKKIVLTVINLLIVSVLFAQRVYVGNVPNPKKTTPINMDGVWEWDATANGNNKMIAKYLNISTRNDQTSAEVTFTPEDVKNSYPNWTLGKRDFSDATWYDNGQFFEIEAGGFTKKIKNEVVEMKRNYLRLFRPEGVPDYILHGVLVVYSWKKSKDPKVKVSGSEEIMLQGVWVNNKKKGTAKPEESTSNLKHFSIEEIERLLNNNSEGINYNNENIIDFDVSKKLKPNSSYTFSIDKIEALTIDNDKCKDKVSKNTAEYIFELSVQIKNRNTELQLFPNVLVAKQNNKGFYGHYIMLELNHPLVLKSQTYNININKQDFKSISLVFEGFINEVAPCDKSGEFIYSNAVALNNPNKSILFDKMKTGSNTVDFNSGNKKLRMYYTIKPQ